MKLCKLSSLAILALAGALLLAFTACSKPATSIPPSQTSPPNAAPTSNLSGELLISAAASMKDAMAEIETDFSKLYPDLHLTFNFGGSGALQQQIEQGAPADIFLSAGKKQMDALSAKDLVTEAADLLQNKVVLIGSMDTDIASFEDLASDKLTFLALGEPGSVPVGQYSAEILDNLNLFDQISKDKIVYGKDVREVLSWVSTGNAEAGMVYATDAVTVSDKVRLIADAPDDAYTPAVYPVGIVKDSKSPNEAKAFYDYLFTESAQVIFAKFGFLTLQ